MLSAYLRLKVECNVPGLGGSTEDKGLVGNLTNSGNGKTAPIPGEEGIPDY